MTLRYSRWSPADRVPDVESHVCAHLSAVADPDDDPDTRATDVRITRVDDEGGVLVTGELDAEADAPYLRPGFTPEPGTGEPADRRAGRAGVVSVARCAEINARLRAAGITVREVGGWQSRGNGQSSAYEGGLVHHTATGFGIALPGTGVGNLLINGRPDLRGPLCNYAGNDDGSITVIAAHPANHAGASGGRSMGPLPVTSLFNPRVLGLEIVYPGTSPMRDAQHRSALVWAKAVADVCGHGDLERIRAHAETSITGKWDPGFASGKTIDMAAFRNAARNAEDDVTPEEHRWLKFVFDRVAGILVQRYYVRDPSDPAGESVREVGQGTPGAIPARVLDTLDGNFLARRLSSLTDDEAKILAAVKSVQDAVEAEDRSVTSEQLEQLAEALAPKLTPELLEEFDAKLRTAVTRAGR